MLSLLQDRVTYTCGTIGAVYQFRNFFSIGPWAGVDFVVHSETAAFPIAAAYGLKLVFGNKNF